MKVSTGSARRRITAATITVAALVGGGLLSASPALAANVGSYDVDCSSTSYVAPTYVAASIGDVVTIHNSGAGACDVTLVGMTSNGDQGPTALPSGETDTYTFTSEGLDYVIVGNALPPATIDYGTIVVASITAPVDAAPAEYLQQLPIPASGSCADVKDADYAWNTGVTGGWSKAWGDWNHNWVCSRVLTNAGGTWHTTNS